MRNSGNQRRHNHTAGGAKPAQQAGANAHNGHSRAFIHHRNQRCAEHLDAALTDNQLHQYAYAGNQEQGSPRYTLQSLALVRNLEEGKHCCHSEAY